MKMNVLNVSMKRLALLFVIALSVACAGEQNLSFEARVGDTPWTCGSDIEGVGLSSSTISPRDFRVFIHDIKLDGVEVNVPDGPFSKDGTVLLDFADDTGGCTSTPETNTELTINSTLSTGELEFTIGVPFEQNHQDVEVADAPFNDPTLFWNWQAGYKFVRIDHATTGLESHSFHLGSTGCETDENDVVTSCANENRQTFRANVDFDTSVAVFDLETLFGNSDLDVDEGGVPGCLSAPTDPECDSILTRVDDFMRFE